MSSVRVVPSSSRAKPPSRETETVLITVGSAVRFIHRASFQGGWIRDFAKEESADQARPQARRGYHNYNNRFFKKKKGRNYRLSKNFLRNKKFMGGIKPHVMVEPLQLENGVIDVIIVKNGYYTPYVLEENYRSVNANNIYTRIMDSNTPKNKTAEISHIEYLWKKRFRLLDTSLERAFFYLKSKEDWLDVEDNSSMIRKYYKYAPEYIIEHCECDDRDGYEYYLFSQMDSRPHWHNIYIRYHQTTLFSTIGIALDGGRYFTNVPWTGFLFEGLNEKNISFKFMVNDTKEMILHEFLCDNESHEALSARGKFEECILIFFSEEEKEDFKKYAADKWIERQKYLEDEQLPYMKLPKSYRQDAFKEEYENAIVLRKMLKEYRKCKNRDFENIS